MSKKNIIVISEQGNSGKSYISTNIIDHLRNVFHKECAGYLLDVEQVAVLNRLGERDSKGKLLREQTDPLKGIVCFDILNQGNLEEGKAHQAGTKMLDSLASDYEYSVYDFPGQGRSAFQKMFQQHELELALEVSDKETIIVIPVIEKKSLVSVEKIKEMFTFTGDFEHLNAKITFVVVYNPINPKADLLFDGYKETKQHLDLSALGNRYKLVQLANISSTFLDMVRDQPFTHFYDTQTKKARNITEEMTNEGFGPVNAMIALRRIFTNSTGFTDIVQNNIL
jgi:hypothetical protein